MQAFSIFNGTAAESQYHSLVPTQLGDQLRFELAEAKLSVRRKKCRDAHPDALDQLSIRIKKTPPEHGGERPAHGRLTRTHEADQRDTSYLATSAHARRPYLVFDSVGPRAVLMFSHTAGEGS